MNLPLCEGIIKYRLKFQKRIDVLALIVIFDRPLDSSKSKHPKANKMNDIKDQDWLFEIKRGSQFSRLCIKTVWQYSNLLLSFLTRFIISSYHQIVDLLLFHFTPYFPKNKNLFLFRSLLPSKFDINLIKHDFNMVLLNLTVSTILATIDLNS